MFESMPSSEPWDTQRYAKTVDVGYLSVLANPAQTVQALQSVPIDNYDREFNCQTWVEAALRRLKDVGHLSPVTYERGIDGMIDAIAEAEHTEE